MPAQCSIARFVYLRVLGVCLVFAFAALWEQAPGLVGPHGLSPLDEILAQWRRTSGGAAFWHAPSLFWLCASPTFVAAVAAMGALAGVALTSGVAPRWCCIAAYAAWLSFRAIDGGVVRWFNFPFDDLQSEMLVIGALVAPRGWKPQVRVPPLPRWVYWLVVWFAFRVMFGPGLAKVLYHAPWRDLSAIEGFLVAMPHPTAAAAWFADLGRPWTQLMAAFALFCEVVCPWLYFVPGRTRRFAAAAGIALMVGIQLVCNIRGFQPLTAALLLLLWDDAALRALLPRRWRGDAVAVTFPPAPRWRRVTGGVVFTVLVAASIGPNLDAFGFSSAQWPRPLAVAARALTPFRLAGAYTMFCILPPERYALVVEGSDDGVAWLDYEPRHVPARVDRTPGYFAPYHDYLGFRLWLAAFAPPSEDAWLRALQQRLLAGEPAVQALFRTVPFAAPPAFVRVEAVRFRFAPPQLRCDGVFWVRESLGLRLPPARRG